jgi:hypothetical protein
MQSATLGLPSIVAVCLRLAVTYCVVVVRLVLAMVVGSVCRTEGWSADQ